MSLNEQLIKKLYAKSETRKIPITPVEGEEQIELTFYRLSVDDMGLLGLGQNASVDEISKNAIELYTKTFRISEEEAKQISLEYAEDLMTVIMDINKLDKMNKNATDKLKKLAEKKGYNLVKNDRSN